MEINLETKRLIIREIVNEDLDGMYELDSDPDVHKYLGNKPVRSKREIIESIDFIRGQYTDNGIGRWAIIYKATNEFIGWTGLKYVTNSTNGHINYYDLGYRLIKRYWGQGIATESALPSLKYAFDKLSANEVFAMAECENIGSNKILRKLGLRFVEVFDYEGIKHNWYKIKKEEFSRMKL